MKRHRAPECGGRLKIQYIANAIGHPTHEACTAGGMIYRGLPDSARLEIYFIPQDY